MSFFRLKKKKMKSMFLRFYKLAKNEIHVLWAFVACKRWKPCFLRFCKLAKNKMHVFWGFATLQKRMHAFWAFLAHKKKMKSMFSEVLQVCKKWKPCFLRFFKFAKNESHVFWPFLLVKDENNVFWDFATLQKIKFIFF